MSGLSVPEIVGFGALGMAVGTVYFLLLRYSVSLFVRNGAALQALPLMLARAGAAVLMFWIAAQAGLWPLLAAAAGFVAARSAIILSTGRRA